MNELALFAGAPMNIHWKTPEYMRVRSKAWREANPDWVKQYRKENRRKHYLQEAKRKYGISPEEFTAMFDAQNQSCAVCKMLFDWSDKQTKPHIDHCHATGKVRGILCNRCNSILGLVKDDADLLTSLAGYLG